MAPAAAWRRGRAWRSRRCRRCRAARRRRPTARSAAAPPSGRSACPRALCTAAWRVRTVGVCACARVRGVCWRGVRAACGAREDREEGDPAAAHGLDQRERRHRQRDQREERATDVGDEPEPPERVGRVREQHLLRVRARVRAALCSRGACIARARLRLRLRVGRVTFRSIESCGRSVVACFCTTLPMLVVAEPSTASSSAIVWCWWCASALAAAASTSTGGMWLGRRPVGGAEEGKRARTPFSLARFVARNGKIRRRLETNSERAGYLPPPVRRVGGLRDFELSSRANGSVLEPSGAQQRMGTEPGPGAAHEPPAAYPGEHRRAQTGPGGRASHALRSQSIGRHQEGDLGGAGGSADSQEYLRDRRGCYNAGIYAGAHA